MSVGVTRRIAAAFVGVVLAVLLIAPASGSAAVKIGSTVRLQVLEFDTTRAILDGEVRSRAARCRGARKVNVSFAGERLAQATTAKDGAFAFAFALNNSAPFGEDYPLVAGDYVLTALRDKFGRPGRRKVCKPDSAVFHVENVARSITATETDAFTFAGAIASDEPGCAAGETVETHYSANGDTFEPTEFADEADEAGNWAVNLGQDAPAGVYAFIVWARTLPPIAAANGDLTLKQCVDDDARVEVGPNEGLAPRGAAFGLDVPRTEQFGR